jgi:superfamily II DNA/RNA helicase
MSRSGTPQDLIAKTALRSLQSSPPAAEGVLRRLSERLEADSPFEQFTESAEEEEPLEDLPRFQLSSSAAAEALRVIARTSELFEAITVDSKLNELAKLLSHLTDMKTGSQRICVMTDYVATLFYLSADFEDRSMNCILLYGAMSAEDRHRSLKSFANAKGILLATRAATEGDTFGEVTDLVLYDIPRSRTALLDLLGRFDRFDRQSQLKIHVLAPSDSVNGPDFEPLRLLREILNSER